MMGSDCSEDDDNDRERLFKLLPFLFLFGVFKVKTLLFPILVGDTIQMSPSVTALVVVITFISVLYVT